MGTQGHCSVSSSSMQHWLMRVEHRGQRCVIASPAPDTSSSLNVAFHAASCPGDRHCYRVAYALHAASSGEAPEKQHCSKEPSDLPDQTLLAMSSRAGHLFLIHALARVVSRPVTVAQAAAAMPAAQATLNTYHIRAYQELVRRWHTVKHARALESPSAVSYTHLTLPTKA